MFTEPNKSKTPSVASCTGFFNVNLEPVGRYENYSNRRKTHVPIND
nr:MAG TPA: hypothetical protein [Caudoviricetes sp.]